MMDAVKNESLNVLNVIQMRSDKTTGKTTQFQIN